MTQRSRKTELIILAGGNKIVLLNVKHAVIPLGYWWWFAVPHRGPLIHSN